MRKSSIIDDLIFLPWWVNSVFGGTIYLLLRFILPELSTDSAIHSGIFNALK